MVEQVQNLNCVTEPYAGQRVYSVEDDGIFRWDPVAGWEPVPVEGGISMNLYDINKQVISQLPDLDADELQSKRQLINNYCTKNANTFYMLLCREINYFTLFHRSSSEADDLGKEALLCAKDIGTIKAIDENDCGAIEFWVADEENTYVMLLFPYDSGVIVCK